MPRCELGRPSDESDELLSRLLGLPQGNPRRCNQETEGVVLRMPHEMRLSVPQGRARTIRHEANANEQVRCARLRKTPGHCRDGILLCPHRVPGSLALLRELVKLLWRRCLLRYLRFSKALAAARSA